MTGHFDCIGIDDLIGAMKHTVEHGAKHARDDGGRTFVWRDESGASVAVHASERQIICAFPSFRTELTVPVRVHEVFEDDRCPFCAAVTLDAADDGGELDFRLASQFEDLDQVRRDPAGATRRTARLVGFAEELRSWASEDDFQRHLEGQEVQLGPQSVIPTGLFDVEDRQSGTDRARNLLTGVVEERHTLRNTLTDRSFIRLRARSCATFDVVAAPGDVPPDQRPGSVVQAVCWMVGGTE
jgi:hypothetical protein